LPLSWDEVHVEPSERGRMLPDGREMVESRLTVSRAMIDQMWQGYRCASCLEDLTELGAFPKECPLCHFPVKALQRQQLEQDFVGEVEKMHGEGFIDTELATLERSQHVSKPQIHVRRDL
jgi:hypothetical protein